MLQQFKDYINRQHLLPSDGRQVLLAVSGGRDSVVLTDLMHRAALPFTIAHCNFHLREAESDRDQDFVRRLAARLNVPFHTVDFDTRAYAADHHESIEEAARHLRYGYFAELCSTHGYPCVVTAHHRDDSIETLFLNLLRGTGLHGLHGIRPRSSLITHHSSLTIVRPLLCFSRADIDRYVADRGLDYVDDSTNFEADARRNALRLRVLPLLRDLYPSFDATMQANIDRFADAGEVYDRYVADLRAHLVTEEPSRLPTLHSPLSTLRLQDLPEPRATLLYELLRPYGFSADSAAAILSKPLRTGSHFSSPTHEVVVDRGRLIVAPLTAPVAPTINIEEFPNNSSLITHHSSLITHHSSLAITVDADLLRQPLTLRTWRAGDRFCPFGMKQSRLVSDFLKDCKLSLIEKRHVYVLLDAEGRIVWLVGLRADNRFRITAATRRLLRITCA